jgi:predicted SAM-dependent methyltransferase
MKAMHSKCVEPNTELEILKALKIDFNDYKDRLNLACGADYREGWANQDFDRRVRADIYCDLEERLPISEASFDLIYACHILEHIRELQNLKAELYRILKPGGVLVCVVPHYLSVDAWGNPQHIRAFSKDSFHVGQFWPGDYEQYMELFEMDLKNEDESYQAKWIISKRTKVKA